MPGKRCINGRELRQLYTKLGAKETIAHLTEAMEKKQLKADDFSIRELAESLVPDGREWVDAMNPNRGGGDILEASGAVDSAAFANITGQIVYSRMLEAFESEEFIFSAEIPKVPTQFNGEKIAGISRIGDQAEVVDEGQPYPLAGVGEDWIETPLTVKRGMIVPVTKEAVFFDRTGLILSRAAEVGEFLGLNKEKRAIDCVIDENTTKHRYKWRGTSYATYQSSSPWDNVTASNALVDWTDVENAELTLADITDPNTGEPVMVTADTLICTPQLKYTALRIVNATEITVATPGFATSANPTQTRVQNPVGGMYKVMSSRLLKARLATDTSWFLGNLKKAFAYMENFPLTVSQAPTNAAAEFERDIVAQYKASERGAYATIEPRVITTCAA